MEGAIYAGKLVAGIGGSIISCQKSVFSLQQGQDNQCQTLLVIFESPFVKPINC